jgi:NitT/TauT family transport system substrate-binding protein
MGGPQQNPAQLLLAGRVDMIMSSGFQALNYVRENIPFMAIGAIMQKDPQGFMFHAEAGFNSFEQMRGRPILVGAGGRVTYWPFLRRRFGFTDSQIRPYTFNIQPFLADKQAIQRVLLCADAGFPNYQTTIDISRRLVDEKPDLIQRFVDATMQGWTQYLRGQDVAAANALIMRDNQEMTQEKIDYAVRALNERGIVLSGDAERLGVGAMTDERWEAFYTAMRDAEVMPPGLDVKRAYSLRFVNRRVGLA